MKLGCRHGRVFSSKRPDRCWMDPAQPPVQCVPEGGSVLVVEEAEARSRSLPSSAEVKNGCPICHRDVHKDNCAFIS